MFRLWSSSTLSLRLSKFNASSPIYPRCLRCRRSVNNPKQWRRLSSTVDPKSLMMDLKSDLFNYTTGRFLANDAYRLRERQRIFDMPGLFNIVANAMNCKVEQITDFRRLAEGGLNRVFLVTLDTNLKLVARIPYPLLVPKAYAVASEVATMDYLRSKGVPTPKVYAYSFTPDNEAQTEYVLMEYIEGRDLREVWFYLKKNEIISLMNQLVKIESAMMATSFPAGGSIYYAEDLKKLCGKEGITIEEQEQVNDGKGRFCVGPDVSVALWYGRREQLDVFRGPYEDAESVLVAGAKKELAYLEQFGSPKQPYDRSRRNYYYFKPQLPSDHAQNLQHYLLLAPSLVPKDDLLTTFRLRHPDLTENNIRISTSASGDLQIVGVLDWQHTAVLPLFLNAGMPDFVQNQADEFSRSMKKPVVPDNLDELSEEEQEVLRRRLVYYYYVISTLTYNKLHQKGLAYSHNAACRRIYIHATAPWKGETIGLRFALINCVLDWAESASDERCPVAFTATEIEEAVNLMQGLQEAEEDDRLLRTYIGYNDDTWVPAADYEAARTRAQEVKQKSFEFTESEEESAAIDANWLFDDMDEAELEGYK
ncbi:hypothetical protein MIND_00426100 [Mycena indigotica]|uniref:Aminoglycoside phosphotransferase domain-containing protein n=1 Tax=Mycena indigotica TaxID=2126181 RepID=A0A8H6SVW8_9AGAR|nr:uncharacterized protein MIND_00426100 [Mycena indigotica]KAF7306349.1 hypothetical protein MIND_00426100 [Mycena indigotica]